MGMKETLRCLNSIHSKSSKNFKSQKTLWHNLDFRYDFDVLCFIKLLKVLSDVFWSDDPNVSSPNLYIFSLCQSL